MRELTQILGVLFIIHIFVILSHFRIDPFSCKLILPGQVCDPVEILTPDERRILNEKITRVCNLIYHAHFTYYLAPTNNFKY